MAPVSVRMLRTDDLVAQAALAVTVDVFSGTSLGFRPHQEGVGVEFLPWHRRWSHSLIVALLAGAVVAVLLGPLAGGMITLGAVIHILEDQLGYMGSSLLYPFARAMPRSRGLGLFHSGDALPNLLTVWLSAVLLLINLGRFSSAPLFDPWRLLVLGLALPWVMIGALYGWSRRRRCERQRVDSQDIERQATASRDTLSRGVLVDVSQDGERTPTTGERIGGA
jgi:hypothetical protein